MMVKREPVIGPASANSTATIDRRANVLLRCASFRMRHAASAKAVFSIHRQHTLCFAPVRCCAIPASCACSIDHCEEKISRRRNNAHAIFKITRRGMTYARRTKLLPTMQSKRPDPFDVPLMFSKALTPYSSTTIGICCNGKFSMPAIIKSLLMPRNMTLGSSVPFQEFASISVP